MRTVSDQIWDDRACEFALHPKYNRFQRGWASMVYSFLDKKIGIGSRYKWKASSTSSTIKTIESKFKRTRGYARFEYKNLQQI